VTRSFLVLAFGLPVLAWWAWLVWKTKRPVSWSESFDYDMAVAFTFCMGGLFTVAGAVLLAYGF